MGKMGKSRSRNSAFTKGNHVTVIRTGMLVRFLVLISFGAVIFYVEMIKRFPVSHNDDALHPISMTLDGSKSTKKPPQLTEDKVGATSKDEKGENILEGKETGKITVKLGGKEVEMSSAKALLTSKIPFKDSDAIDLYPDGETKSFIKSPNTIVTGYFQLKSKYDSSEYDGWMKNSLSLQDPMIIFTEQGFVDQIKKFRKHAVDRTVIIPMTLDDLPIGKLYSKEFWQDQLDRDPEKRRHRSYQLFWIWLSKSWFVSQAIRMNIYDSDLFLWSDIGCFRNAKYNDKTVIQHREMVPAHEILQMAHHTPNPPKEALYNDKYKQGAHFYQSGSQLVGFKDTWVTFHNYFLEIIDRFLEKNMIIVEDQAVLQSTCLSHPEICAYVPFQQVNDNNYFGLRYVLHNGGKYEYWRYNPDAKAKE